jgi:hypothetical protein
LYVYAFLNDFVLLYPVYVVLFADTGLSAVEISSLFAIWSATGFALELPSGVWADVVSRRKLLTLAPVLPSAGYALWTFVTSYPAFAAGFILWGAGSALQSGTQQALVYAELQRLGATGAYARLTGRAEAASTVAQLGMDGLESPRWRPGRCWRRAATTRWGSRAWRPPCSPRRSAGRSPKSAPPPRLAVRGVPEIRSAAPTRPCCSAASQRYGARRRLAGP